MLIIALVLAVIGLAALVAAVVTSNELIAWVCIGASVLGTILLIVDALRERSRGAADKSGDEAVGTVADAGEGAVQDYPDEPVEAEAEEAESEEAEPTAESEPVDEVDEPDEAVDEADEADEDDELDDEPAADEAAEEHKS